MNVAPPPNTVEKMFNFMTGSYITMHEFGPIQKDDFIEDNLIFHLNNSAKRIAKFGP